ncbi:MAG: hypothetical protein U1A27_09665 [Phycisphaerae bacterium]
MSLDLGPWRYRAQANPNAADEVPWLLFAEPIGPDARDYQPAQSFNPVVRAQDAPVMRIPRALWRAWLPPDMQDVLGIHYHELVYDDLARIIFTLHPVFAEGADSPVATRIEATLFTPLTYHLDQTIVVRNDREDPAATPGRVEHERGHAEQSLRALLLSLAGPQDWNPERLSGRRSTVAWYWRSRRVSRRWDDYRAGRGEASALRTSVTLVPPTRWSKLLHVPPDRLDPREIERFNAEITALDPRFTAADQDAQDQFHGAHGAFESRRATPP